MKLRQLMKQAQEMQDRMQKEVAALVVEASAGGGMVTLKMSGQKELMSLTIDPEVIDPEDPGMLQDLVMAAVNDASRKVEEAMRDKMGGLTGGLPGMV